MSDVFIRLPGALTGRQQSEWALVLRLGVCPGVAVKGVASATDPTQTNYALGVFVPRAHALGAAK